MVRMLRILYFRLRIYTHLSKGYKHFVTGNLIYFWEKKEISSFLNTVQTNLSNFQQSR